MIEVALDSEDFGPIVRHSTGVMYSNQAGGTSCDHPKAEGFFVPIILQKTHDDHTPFYEEFHHYVCDILPRAIHIDRHATTEIAKSVDEVLSGYRYPFRVDMNALHELQEAWIPIIIDGEISLPFDILIGLFGMRAILTYPNCD